MGSPEWKGGGNIEHPYKLTRLIVCGQLAVKSSLRLRYKRVLPIGFRFERDLPLGCALRIVLPL